MSRIRIENISITDAGTDCIVNAANGQLMGGSGVCGAIFKAAGWDQLQNACNAIGHCDTGSAVITPAFHLNARYIIHAVGPVWQGGKQNEPQKLYGCYRASLNLAREKGCHSIAFPLISAGIFGYPKDKAWRKALQACKDFMQNNPDYDMDILFAVLDKKILRMGLDELENQAKNSVTQTCVSTVPDDELLEKLNGRALYTAIEAVRTAGKVKWAGGAQPDGKFLQPYPEYPEGVWESFSILEPDKEYLEHKEICEGVLPSEMNVQQIRIMFTFISRGERFSNGFLAGYLENRILLKLLLRLDDLLVHYYRRHNLPVEVRYHNPVFWYEMSQERTPVLVKGNGERLTISEKSDMFNQTAQSQQGWQRAMLFMKQNNIWDATAFGAEMSATFAFGPDKEGRVYTFTSCQRAEQNLYTILSADQVKECRKNVNDFYARPTLQMKWKDVILHPVCAVLRRDGSLEPLSISNLDPEILDQYQRDVICIGDNESYRWLFEKNTY